MKVTTIETLTKCYTIGRYYSVHYETHVINSDYTNPHENLKVFDINLRTGNPYKPIYHLDIAHLKSGQAAVAKLVESESYKPVKKRKTGLEKEFDRLPKKVRRFLYGDY